MLRNYLLFPTPLWMALALTLLASVCPARASAVSHYSPVRVTDFVPPQPLFGTAASRFLDPYSYSFSSFWSRPVDVDPGVSWRSSTEEKKHPVRFFSDDYYGTRAFPEAGYSLRINPYFALQSGFDILTEQNALWYMRESGVDDYSMHFNGVKAMLGVAIAPRQSLTVRAGFIGNINTDLPVDSDDPQIRRIRDNASDLVGFLNADWLF